MNLKNFTNIIQLFNLKNSSAMMNLYNSICVSNKKSISSEEFEELPPLSRRIHTYPARLDIVGSYNYMYILSAHS